MAEGNKLWGGRFRGDEDARMERFNSNFNETKWLFAPDVQGSLAHVAMQVKCGLLTPEEGRTLTDGLKALCGEVESGALLLAGDYEDVHSFVEAELTRRVGDVGKKLHTARSRNDQVNTDMKLYVRAQTRCTAQMIDDLCATVKKVADENPCVMPGYTHLQRAQVITMKAHLMAYHGMFLRDAARLQSALEHMDECPLGCGALAGTTHAIDRDFTARELDFARPYANFLDGVSDRDYVLEVLSAFSILMMHLSRLSEELILWGSSEFSYITLSDAYTTGSSIMPQKKNSDGAELIRGKTGRVYGALTGMLTLLKGLPLAYNKDMQEDKELFYDALCTVQLCLPIMERMLATMTVHAQRMKEAVRTGFLNATEVADYLVAHGVAFRDAHSIVGQIVIRCEDAHCAIEDLPLETLREYSAAFDADISAFLDYDSILRKGIKKEML
ncbi:MAG: argininosuccinate lyase [Ruthenibacterium sp.]